MDINEEIDGLVLFGDALRACFTLGFLKRRTVSARVLVSQSHITFYVSCR